MKSPCLPHSGTTNSKTQRGFSLLEVIISITLLSVALSLLLGGFRFTSRALEAGERASAEIASIQTTHRVFGRMVERLFPASLKQEDEHQYAFIGSPTRLRFSAFLPPYPSSGGLHTVEFSIEEGEKQWYIFLNIAPFDPQAFAESELPEEQRALLLETLHKPLFLYLGDAEDGAWQEQWEDDGLLPKLIKIEFKGEATPWPELVKGIPVNADISCAFPDFGGHCRLEN